MNKSLSIKSVHFPWRNRIRRKLSPRNHQCLRTWVLSTNTAQPFALAVPFLEPPRGFHTRAGESKLAFILCALWVWQCSCILPHLFALTALSDNSKTKLFPSNPQISHMQHFHLHLNPQANTKRRQRKSYWRYGTTRNLNHTESIIPHSAEFGISSPVFHYNPRKTNYCLSLHFTTSVKPLSSPGCLSAEYSRAPKSSNNFLSAPLHHYVAYGCVCGSTGQFSLSHLLLEIYCDVNLKDIFLWQNRQIKYDKWEFVRAWHLTSVLGV